jgi:hypothetical protein
MPHHTRPRTRHLTAADGARLLSAWRRRGQLTQREFCHRHAVSAQTLRRWLRLGDDTPTTAVAATPIFTEVRIPSSSANGIQVQLGKAIVSVSLAIPELHTLFRALLSAQELSC